MTIKVYISGICGSHEVRKQQQRVLFILQSLPIDLQIVDITEPGREEDLNVMQEVAKKHDKKTQLPPQIFNGDDYCGDYTDFEVANDDDQIMRFLKLESGIVNSTEAPASLNGIGEHQTNGVSDALEENNSNAINENNVKKEQDPEIVNTEKDTSAAKDSGETLIAENVEVPTSNVDESNKEAAGGDKKGASEEESE